MFPYSADFAKPQDARVSWRQSVRVGLHKGDLIEDDGISADVPFIRPTQLDLIPGSSSNSQYDFIADSLATIGSKNGQNGRYFLVTPEGSSTASIGLPLVFSFDIAKVAKVQIYKSGTALGSPLVVGDQSRHTRQMQFDPKVTSAGTVVFEIRAYDSRGNDLFSTFRTFRFTPNPADFLQLTAKSTLKVDLASGKEIAQFDLSGTTASNGFNANGTNLQIGNGISYDNNLDTQRSFFISSSVPFSAHVKATYSTEIGCDYFFIGYNNKSGTVQFLTGLNTNVKPPIPIPAVSGNGTIDQTFSIPAGDVEFFFRFTSDPAVSFSGVLITDLTFST